MSLSRWTASTRGVAADAVCARTRAANSASEVKNPRKTAGITALHNLPSQGLLGFKPNEERAEGTTDESFPDRSGASARGPGGRARRRCVDLEPRPSARCSACTGCASRSASRSTSSACTGAAAAASSSARARRQARGAPGRRRRPRPRTARPRRVRALRGRAGRSVTRGGRPGSTRLEVRTDRPGDASARLVRPQPVPRAFPCAALPTAGSPKIVPRQRLEGRTRRSSARRRATPRYCASPSSTTRPARARTGPEESAAIVRGIELYHVKANGWNDIGYNFLVDRYGQVFEGRGGGMQRNVIGAHAEGFNTGSVGIAVHRHVLRRSHRLVRRRTLSGKLLAWRLDVGHVDPASSAMIPSGGNPSSGRGRAYLRAISGHRDAGFTACPGNALYARLGAAARGRADDRAAEALRAPAERAGSASGALRRRGCRRRSHGR